MSHCVAAATLFTLYAQSEKEKKNVMMSLVFHELDRFCLHDMIEICCF